MNEASCLPYYINHYLFLVGWFVFFALKSIQSNHFNFHRNIWLNAYFIPNVAWPSNNSSHYIQWQFPIDDELSLNLSISRNSLTASDMCISDNRLVLHVMLSLLIAIVSIVILNCHRFKRFIENHIASVYVLNYDEQF